MPINVPEEPKVYTTVYDNFKGVDFTNDATNVWKHRSPSGKNMLPDLDGKPYKRTGWEVELTAQDFIDAAGVSDSVEVIPDKTYYFEIGGYDFLMIFNNLGIFTYRTNPLEAQRAVYPKLLVHQSKYIPAGSNFDPDEDNPSGLPNFPPQIDGQNVPIDSGRAFFFEGKGTAGFYVFVGLKLFRYDGAYFREVDPHVPVVLIGCSPNGAGTTLEAINMLTDKRIVQYYCDGTTGIFTIPGGIDTSKPYTVELRNTSGDWVTVESGYTYSNGKISFSEAPPVVVEGEDNLRVTYVADGIGSSVSEKEVDVDEKTVIVKRMSHQYQTCVDNGASQSAWITNKLTYEFVGQTFSTPNIKINDQTKHKEAVIQCRNSTNTGWQTLASANYWASWGAYNSNIKVTANANIINTSAPPSKHTTATGKATTWQSYSSFKTTVKKVVNGKTQTTTTTHYRKRRTRIVTDWFYYRIRVHYTKYEYSRSSAVNESKTAFTQATRALVFGSGIINQVFMSSSPYPEYNTRVWYSAATDPTYFPETNYIEVGSTDTPIMGMMKVGEYLGIIKQGISFDTSIYLAYPTSFDDDTTYAVKQNINGIGAISKGAFNSLNEEPLFLSKDGVMGIEVSAGDTDRQLRNRSHFINKKLNGESNLNQAISFVYKGLYYLAVNNCCYVLDGSQKSSWANTKTNLQYECYYLENVPAQCFAKFEDELYFNDFKGNLCRFKHDGDENVYRDEYSVYDPDIEVANAPIDGNINISDIPTGAEVAIGNTVRYLDDWYTITDINDDAVTVTGGVAIDAVWSTIADDDESPHFFKNLKKKGTMISLLPSSDSGVNVSIKQDSKDPVFVGETDAKDYELPFDFYSKKKIKKYKRLQFICENNVIDDSFGVDQIIKSYTVGNYSKNRA